MNEGTGLRSSREVYRLRTVAVLHIREDTLLVFMRDHLFYATVGIFNIQQINRCYPKLTSYVKFNDIGLPFNALDHIGCTGKNAIEAASPANPS